MQKKKKIRAMSILPCTTKENSQNKSVSFFDGIAYFIRGRLKNKQIESPSEL